MCFLLSQASNKKFLCIRKNIFEISGIEKSKATKEGIKDLESLKTVSKRRFNTRVNVQAASIRKTMKYFQKKNIFIKAGFYSELVLFRTDFLFKAKFIQKRFLFTFGMDA